MFYLLDTSKFVISPTHYQSLLWVLIHDTIAEVSMLPYAAVMQVCRI